MTIEENIQQYEGQPLTRQLLMGLLKEYKRPYDKINELVKQEKLLPVKRGIFIPGRKLNVRQPEAFLLANIMYGPSYISMESALSYHGLIPEQVFEISSVTTDRTKSFDTAAGRFSYIHLPLPWYSYGQQQVQLNKQQMALLATPEKALCDKIICTSGLIFRSVSQIRQWLTDDMRMDIEVLKMMNIARINSWLKKAPKKESLELLTKTLSQL